MAVLLVTGRNAEKQLHYADFLFSWKKVLCDLDSSLPITIYPNEQLISRYFPTCYASVYF